MDLEDFLNRLDEEVLSNVGELTDERKEMLKGFIEDFKSHKKEAREDPFAWKDKARSRLENSKDFTIRDEDMDTITSNKWKKGELDKFQEVAQQDVSKFKNEIKKKASKEYIDFMEENYGNDDQAWEAVKYI